MTDKAPIHTTNSAQGSKPMPDPTVLTTEQLLREVSGIEKSIKILDDHAGERLGIVVSAIEKQLECAKEISEVRFASFEKQFEAIELWRREQKIDTKTAVDAALLAAKEAVKEQTASSKESVAKSEATATEQMKQQYATFNAAMGGMTATVSDLKDRVVKIESVKLGAAEIRVDQRQNSTLILAVIGGFVTLILAVMAIAGFVMANTK